MPSYMSLEEIQTALLETLVSFDAFCRDNDLRYSLSAGTLLGAVRHKGFIPWDADVDVAMPRPDFEHMRALAGTIPEGFDLIDNKNSGFAYPFAKYRNLAYRAQEESSEGEVEGYIWVDIFPWDGVSSDEKELAKLTRRISWLKHRMTWLSVNVGKTYRDNLGKRIIAGCYAGLPGRKRRRLALIGRLDDLLATCDYQNSERVCSLCSDSTPRWTLDRERFEGSIPLEFCGRNFQAMTCWEDYLRSGYGDYMQLPPESQREDHHRMKAWRVGDAE